MDALLLYCDTGSPSRYLRYLEAGMYHQVLADSGMQVTSTLLHADRRAEEVSEAFRATPARLVVFYFDEFNGTASLKMAQRLKAQFPDTPIAAVGVLPLLAPDRIIHDPAIDYLLLGEAEFALYELATALRSSSADVAAIKNLWWRHTGQVQRNPLRPLQENLDAIPYANRALFDQEPQLTPGSERTLFAAATRGCIYDCQFCYIPPVKRAYEGKGTFYRMRTPQHLVGEILGELRRREYGCIRFVDEQFPTDKNWLRIFAQRMSTTGVPFQAVVSHERCDTDVLDLLKSAGCERLVIGVETGNEGFRRRVASRNIGNDRLRAWVAAVRERGMGVVTTNMLGLPLESEPLTQETYALNQELAVDEVRTCVFQPIEGTPLHQYATEKQYLPAGAQPAEPDFTRLTMALPELNAEQVRATMYRMHFLNLMQHMKSLPPGEGYFDFLREVPRAKFKMSHSAAVDVQTVRRGAQPFGYLALESGSEIRYKLDAAADSLLKFRLHIPEASLQRLQNARSRIIAEIVWSVDDEVQTLFGRLIGPKEAGLARGWQECVANGPDHPGRGELIFRVGAWPESDLKAFVFFGAPEIHDEKSRRRRTSDSSAAMPAAQPGMFPPPESPQVSAELEQARQAVAAAQAEREQKIKRIAELQMRILELEKELESRPPATSPTDAKIGDRLKGIFRK